VIRVRLMERPGCGLCEEALGALRRASRRTPVDIERVDVTRDPKLLERYVLRIPVLVVGDAELDAAGIEDAAIGRWLDEVSG
jgi:hypothetical protein